MKRLKDLLGDMMHWFGMVLLLALLIAVPLWQIWNGLMPELFHLVRINYWHAVGINLIARLIFTAASAGNDYFFSK